MAREHILGPQAGGRAIRSIKGTRYLIRETAKFSIVSKELPSGRLVWRLAGPGCIGYHCTSGDRPTFDRRIAGIYDEIGGRE